MLSEKYKCDQPGKTEFLVAPLDNGHFITGVAMDKYPIILAVYEADLEATKILESGI